MDEGVFEDEDAFAGVVFEFTAGEVFTTAVELGETLLPEDELELMLAGLATELIDEEGLCKFAPSVDFKPAFGGVLVEGSLLGVVVELVPERGAAVG